MTSRPPAATCWAFALAALVGCSGSPTGPSERVLFGTWGGDHVTLTIGDDSSRLEFDCAHGDISGPLRLDDRGRFPASSFVSMAAQFAKAIRRTRILPFTRAP